MRTLIGRRLIWRADKSAHLQQAFDGLFRHVEIPASCLDKPFGSEVGFVATRRTVEPYQFTHRGASRGRETRPTLRVAASRAAPTAARTRRIRAARAPQQPRLAARVSRGSVLQSSRFLCRAMRDLVGGLDQSERPIFRVHRLEDGSRASAHRRPSKALSSLRRWPVDRPG